MHRLPVILTAFLIVITDPYKDIKYDEIAVYNYESECSPNCIGYTESEGWNENEFDNNEPEDLSNYNYSDYDRRVFELSKQIILITQPVLN